jgi:DNA-binding NarL/FixJ family response regulator
VTSVIIADDESLVREGLSELLSRRGITVLAAAANGQEAFELTLATKPDVVLMDIQMPVMDGIEATARIVERCTSKVLILTTYHQDEYVFRALRAGASGFLLKSAEPDRLAQAVELISLGEALLAPEVTARLIAAHISSGPATPPQSRKANSGLQLKLTPREREVLVLVAQGLSNDDISRALVLSASTVKTHLNRIFAKLQLSSRAQLVVFAYEEHLVTPNTR